jgi:hypothetical protein
MINLVVMAISAILLALFLIWWRSPAFRAWVEAPKCLMLHQERRFGDQLKERNSRDHEPGGSRATARVSSGEFIELS